MVQKATYDLRNNLGHGVSLEPGGTTYQGSADLDGDWVDASNWEGPVQAICATGAATGGPSAISVNFEMYEADDSSGTNAQKVSTQEEVTITADKTAAVLHAHTSKPFVKVKVEDDDSSITGGSSPAVPVSAVVVAQKKTV